MKVMQLQSDNSINGTILTIVISAIGLTELDVMSKIVFMVASTTTAIFTCVHTYNKIKNQKK
jgi:hypothetical protein